VKNSLSGPGETVIDEGNTIASYPGERGQLSPVLSISIYDGILGFWDL
jgi:hypothetical protein